MTKKASPLLILVVKHVVMQQPDPLLDLYNVSAACIDVKLVKHFRMNILVHRVSYAMHRKKKCCGVRWNVISSVANYSIITVHVCTPTPY